MARHQADDFLAITCAVIAGKLSRSEYDRVGEGDVAADYRAAKKIRAASKAIYSEIVEEMLAICAGHDEETP